MFTTVTVEGWTYVMANLWEAYSPVVIIYSMLMVFIGSFFLMELTLAVIKAKFSEAHSKKEEDFGNIKINHLIEPQFEDMNRKEKAKLVE